MTSRKDKFTDIYNKNYWASKETISGGGSELSNVKNVVTQLPQLIKKYKIKSILDCACGDCNWIKYIDLQVEKYIGVDIVDEIIEKNKKINIPNSKFFVLDLVIDPLPKVDLIICKDVFIHLPNIDILKALKNFKSSGSKYLLVTNSFEISENFDGNLGDCRGMNLELKPFNLSKPIDNIEIGMHSSNLTLFKL